MAKYILFLRGIMPTGKNKVPMAELRTALEKNGFNEVQTYIQSGNVILSSTKTKAATEKLVEAIIKKTFGGDIPTIARTPKELEAVLNKNPFSKNYQAQTYFTLLADTPDKNKATDLLSLDFSPDEVEIIGANLYTRYNTKHSDSKFNNNFYERKLGITATTRNHNTLTNILAILKDK